jgi:hypothetical protein
MKEFSLLKKFNWELLNSPIPAPVIPPYKVYTALISQSGINNPSLTVGDENVIKGVTYTITFNPDNNNLIPFGAPNSNVGTTFVATVDSALNYTTSLELEWNQAAPIVAVLENTLGDIWFTYNGEGNYAAQSNSLFIQDKSSIIVGNPTWDGGNGFIYSGFDGESFAIIVTKNITGDQESTGSLFQTFFEIRVYN